MSLGSGECLSLIPVFKTLNARSWFSQLCLQSGHGHVAKIEPIRTSLGLWIRSYCTQTAETPHWWWQPHLGFSNCRGVVTVTGRVQSKWCRWCLRQCPCLPSPAVVQQWPGLVLYRWLYFSCCASLYACLFYQLRGPISWSFCELSNSLSTHFFFCLSQLLSVACS